MWLQILCLSALCSLIWSACPTILVNSAMNNTPVSGGVLSGWTKHDAILNSCNAYPRGGGGVLKVTDISGYSDSVVYQTVTTVTAVSYTWSCDFYDYEGTGLLDVVNGNNPLVTSISGYPKTIPRGGWKTTMGTFSAQSTVTTVSVFTTRTCMRNCQLIPATCGTPAPTPSPIVSPVIALARLLSNGLTVNISSSNSGQFNTRCVLNTGPAYTDSTAFWQLTATSSGVIALLESTSTIPFQFTFSSLTSSTSYVIGCSCSNGLRSAVISTTVTTLPKCSDGVTCPATSRCMDTIDGTTPMCSPYFDGVKLTSSATPCRHSGGTTFFTNLTTTAGGDSLTVCLVVGSNTNAATYSSTITMSYGLNTSTNLVSCLNPTFSGVTMSGGIGYLTATCITSPGVGRVLNFSLFFQPSNAVASATVSTPDYVSYPPPSIIPSTSRFASVVGSPFVSSLTSLTTESVAIAFSVTNIAPSSPLLRVFYGPDPNPRQLECIIDRTRSNYTTIVCATDPTTTYSVLPYKWTVVAGDYSVRGTDTFNLAANFPRVLSANASKCVNVGGRVQNCPTVGSTTAAPVVLTVYGFNFGNVSIRVSVDGLLCPFVAAQPGNGNTIPDAVTCLLPANTGFNRNVFVQVADQFSSPLPLVSYNGPTIFRLCGCDTPCNLISLSVANCARAGGDTLDVYGTFFGLQGASVLVGSSACQNVVHDAFSPDTHISCQLLGGYSVHSSVIVIQQNGPNSASGAVAQISYALCFPGTIQYGSDTTCRDCAAGSYAPLAGQQQCLQCAPGSISNQTRQTTCLACAAGTYQSLSNQTQCLACDLGTFAATSGLSQCGKCAPGTFSNSTGNQECDDCSIGTYISTPQATECFDCGLGMYATVPGQPQCSVCAAGTYSNFSGASVCFSCGRGEYMSVTGQSSCRPCDVGKWSSDSFSIQCLNCPAGSYSNVSAATVCYACAKGFYQPSTGANFCPACPIGFVSNTEGVSCSICPAGSRADADKCVACDPGTYQGTPGQSSCLNCLPGTAIDTAGAVACLKCEDGKVASTEGLSICAPCPKNSRQQGTPPSCACLPEYYMGHQGVCIPCGPGMQCDNYGIAQDALVAQSGYLKLGNLTMFLKCLDATFCPGGMTQCAPYRTGPLCNTCQEGYRPVQGEAWCSLCPKEGTSAFYIIIIAFLLLLGLTLLYVFMLRTDMHLFAAMDTKRRQWWQESEKEDIVDPGLRLSTEEVEVLPDESPIVNGRAENRIKKTLSYQFKIFITFLQLVTALLSLSNVNWPPTFQYFIGGFDFINLNFLPWNYVGCITKFRLFDKIMLTAFFPPLFLLIIGGPLLGILWCLEKRDESDRDDSRVKRAQAKSVFWRIIVFTLFLCYPAVSRQIITYFRCVAVPDGTGNVDYYLLVSFWEQCYDEQWYQLLAPVILTLLLYPIGIPLGLLWALVHFRPWFRDINILYSLGLAYSGFHPEFWWFELVDMLHKLTLTCLVALFAERTGQIVSALVISALYVLVLLLTMPYLRLHDNLLHLLSQVEVFLLVLSMQCGGDTSGVSAGSVTDVLVSGVLIIIVVAVITAFLILIIRYLRLTYLRNVQKRKHRLSEKNSPQLGSLKMEPAISDDADKAQAYLVRTPSARPRMLQE